jgi:hypothetical protein
MQIVLSPEDLVNFFRNVFNTGDVVVKFQKNAIVLEGIDINTLQTYVTAPISSPPHSYPLEKMATPLDEEDLDVVLQSNAALMNTKTRLPRVKRVLGPNEFMDPPPVSDDELRGGGGGF